LTPFFVKIFQECGDYKIIIHLCFSGHEKQLWFAFTPKDESKSFDKAVAPLTKVLLRFKARCFQIPIFHFSLRFR